MIDFIIQKAGGGTINLYSKNASTLSTVTNAEQSQGLNSDDIVRITVESAVKITFDIGDKMNILGRWYKINRLPTVKKTGNRLFTYNIELEGVQYDLARVVYDLTIDTTSNALQDVQADMLTGNLQRFATVLIANANRVFPGKWVLGDFPAGTEDKTLAFGETDNCLLVLQRLCSEYNTEFEIIQAGDVNTLHFRKAGQIYPYTFEYGKGKGLYSLERLNVSTSNIVTRLKVYGGTRNITAKYRAARLCLPGKTKGQSYIQKTGPANNYGIWEATKIFEHIYPKRTGTVTAIDSGNVLKLTDSTMNFDLNEKEADGITTKYLIDGSPAKIHFNTGNLSGYEFEIQSYDHATKTFTLKPFEDERGERFPSEKSSAFKFAVNDKYVLLDIALPQSYIDDAEEQLAEEGGIYYDQNSQPKVQYSLEVAEEFLKELSGAGSITNIFSVGDYIPVKDADIDVDKSVRVQSFTRDLLNPFSYKLNISDTVTTNITNRVISELIEIDKITKINDIKSQVKARRDWRSAQELLDMVFDTEGDYYSEKIKPNSIETSMLAVGAKSTQFGLVGTVIQANYNGNKNSVNVKGGTLSHYAIEESGRNWTLADGTTTLTGDSTPYYIYAKCQKVGTAGSIIFSTSKITVDEDPSFYHFLIGVVNSVDIELGVRSVALTYGFTTINGKFVRTGRIQSNDGSTYFDLDAGVIGGKIRFVSGGAQTDLSDWASDTESSINSKSANFDAQPTKYRKNDTWTLSADTTVNGTAYKQGDILTATQDSTTFNQAHWVKRVRYTDDTAVENLQIGGVNLLDGTSNEWQTVTIPSGTVYLNNFFQDTILEAGQGYTFSWEAEWISGATDMWATIGCGATGYQRDIISTLNSNTHAFNRKSIVFTPSTANLANNYTKFAFRWYNNQQAVSFRYRRLKLEKGSKRTDWDLSKKDRQDKIDQAKQEALAASNTVQTNVNSLNTYVTGAFKDGLIDEAEAKAIEKYKNTINETMAKTEASFLKVFGNAYLEGTAKTDLGNAKINLWGQRDTLLSAINTAIADGKTTVAEKNAVDSAFNTFNNLMSAFQSALEEANKAIQTKLDTLSTEKVNNIQIGGRNLFSVNNFVADNKVRGYSTIEVITHNGNIAYRSTNITNNHNVPRYLQGKFEANTQYYLKFNILWESFTDSGAQYVFTIRYTDGSSSTLWATTSQTTRSLLTTAGKTIDYITTTRQFDGTVVIYNVQIEKGNKATDWSPAPEDVQARIDAAKQDASNAQLTAEQAQLAADGYMRFRYIRDWSKGYSTNPNANHWKEIQVFNKAGVNLAKNKIPTTNGTPHASYPLTNATDEDISTTAINGYPAGQGASLDYLRIDLGQVYYDIDFIKIIHGIDGRITYNTKTEISEDGVNWTTIFDSAVEGTYQETEEGKIHSQRWAKVMAKMNRASATTDKFSGFDGGLATAVIMEMREPSTTTRGDATAFISGMQGALKNLPAFGAGGTYADAIVGIAKAIIYHDGRVKFEEAEITGVINALRGSIGPLDITETGDVVMFSDEESQDKLIFRKSKLPSIASLVSAVNSNGSTGVGAGIATLSTSQVVSGSTNISNDGAIATFNGTTLTLSARGRNQTNGVASYAEAVLYARKNGVRRYKLATVRVWFIDTAYTDESDSITPLTYSLPVDAGLYTFELVIETSGTVSNANATSTSSTFSWVHTVAGVKRQQYGLDGMMFFFSGGHFYFSETGFLDGKAPADKWNTPGVLLSATVNENGGWNRVWGAKQSLTQPPLPSPTGRYTIYHTIGHTNYQVNCTPHVANRSFMVYQKNTNSVVVECRTIGSTPTLVNAMFDIILTGNNY